MDQNKTELFTIRVGAIVAEEKKKAESHDVVDSRLLSLRSHWLLIDFKLEEHVKGFADEFKHARRCRRIWAGSKTGPGRVSELLRLDACE